MSDNNSGTPVEPADVMQPMPDIPEGCYQARAIVKKTEAKSNGNPQMIVEWTITSAEDPENAFAVGRQTADFITTFSQKDKGFRLYADKMRALTRTYGLPDPNTSSLGDEDRKRRLDSFDPWIASLESEDRTVYVVHTKDKRTDEIRENVHYAKPKQKV